MKDGLRLQIGANANKDANSLKLDNVTFFNGNADPDTKNIGINSVSLGKSIDAGKKGDGMKGVGIRANVDYAYVNASAAAQYVDIIDAAINEISNKKSM